MKIRHLLTAVAMAGWLAAQPAPASASCAMPPETPEHLAAADVVFVGTVQSLGDLNRTATFAVAEQWHGDPLPAMVTVHGGPGDPMTASSADRRYELGIRYLVAAWWKDGGLTDNACSATRPWSDELAAFRPAGVRVPPPIASEGDVGVPAAVLVGGVVAIGLLLVVSVMAFRPTKAQQ